MLATLLSGAEDLPESDWQSLETGDDPFISRAFLV